MKKRTVFVQAFLMAVCLGLLSPILSAQDFNATVAKITGKVEVQANGAWSPAKLGQVIPAGTTLSTGFRSELLLKIGASVMTVKALSRLTVRDLAKKEGIANTDLYLKVGKVDVDVKPVPGAQQKFRVESPVSTASVRGTAFSFDGETLAVQRGLVQFSDSGGGNVAVPPGEMAKAPPPGSTQDIKSNQELTLQSCVVSSDAGGEYGSDSLSSDDGYDSFTGFSLDDLLSLLNSWDWSSELPNTYLTLQGIKL